MPLVPAKSLVDAAFAGRYAVPAINTNGGNYDIVRACIEAAQESRSPLILAVYPANTSYVGLGYASQVVRTLADPSPVPLVLHLDHGSSFGEAALAVRAGFTSVMVDYSKYRVSENAAMTGKVVDMARACDVTVEAEVGQLLPSGESDPDSPLVASVEDVRAFLAAVSVDMLAIAIGNSHGFYKGPPKLNMERLKEIRSVTSLPLVMHGCTGLPDDTVKECVRQGMAKINFGTLIRTNYIKYFDQAVDSIEHNGHPWRILQVVKDRLKEDVKRIINLVGSAGRVP